VNHPGSCISPGVGRGLARIVVPPCDPLGQSPTPAERSAPLDVIEVQFVLTHLQRRIRAIQALCEAGASGDKTQPVVDLAHLPETLWPLVGALMPGGEGPGPTGDPLSESGGISCPACVDDVVPQSKLAVETGTPGVEQSVCRGAIRPKHPGPGEIVVAPRLSPTQVAVFAAHGVQGFVLEECGWQSDTMRLARFLQIPVVGGFREACTRIASGTPVVVDGTQGLVRVESESDPVPSPPGVEAIGVGETGFLSAVGNEWESHAALLPTVTPDGVTLRMLLNLETPADFEALCRLWPDGIGLWRTDLLRLLHPSPPSLDEHRQFFASLTDTPDDLEVQIVLMEARRFPRELTERPSDTVGSSSVNLLQAPFPLLPPRAWLEPQVQVLAELATRRPLTVLLTGIESPEDFVGVVQTLCAIVGGAQKADLPFRLGVVVETPAAALSAPAWLPLVDAVVVDVESLARGLVGIRDDQEPVSKVSLCLLPAVLQCLANLVGLSQSHRVRLTLAGDVLGEPAMIAATLALGGRRLSVPARALASAQNTVRRLSIRGLGELQHLILSGGSAGEIRSWIVSHVDPQ